MCSVLLIRDSRSCYYPSLSLYLDSSGDVGSSKLNHRPMFLSMTRYLKLQEMYLTHQISREVVRQRTTANAVIHQNYY
jgi:hypothetical protein